MSGGIANKKKKKRGPGGGGKSLFRVSDYAQEKEKYFRSSE